MARQSASRWAAPLALLVSFALSNTTTAAERSHEAVVAGIGMAEAAQSAETAADACLTETQVIQRLLCIADVAKRTADPALCQRATHEGVRWQCVAILAEHLKDADLCRTIPRTDDDYQGLYDICLSDVAEVRHEPALCVEIETQGLRDSCYLKVVEGGASRELCRRIVDPGLKSACTGEAVYVD